MLRGGCWSGMRTVMRSPRERRREARAVLPSTLTSLSATSRAAWVREIPSWSARNRSRRSVSELTTVSCNGSTSRDRLRFRPARVLSPEGNRKSDRTTTHGNISHVERGPAQGADSNVEKVDHSPRASHAIQQIAGSAAGYQSERQLPEPVCHRTAARHAGQYD